MTLPSSRPQSNVYSWLYSQEEEDCYSEHYPALSSSSSNSSSPYSSASEYITSRLSDSSFSPIQKGNSFSKTSTTAVSTESRENPPRSILSETSRSRESSPNSLGGELHYNQDVEIYPCQRSSNQELHYASTDILALPWHSHNNNGGKKSRKFAKSGAATEFVYLDFSVPPSDGWMVTKKALHWPVRSAYM